MTYRIIFKLFAIAAFALAPLEGSKLAYERDDINFDIIKVLKITEPQWLFQQTYDTSVPVPSLEPNVPIFQLTETCVHVVITNISQKECRFTKKLIAGGVSITIPYMGMFDKKENAQNSPLLSMMVYKENGTDLLFTMTLRYSDENSGCNVFSVVFFEDGVKYDDNDCEVYVRNSHISEGPSKECLNYFNTCCNATRPYQPYKGSCHIWKK